MLYFFGPTKTHFQDGKILMVGKITKKTSRSKHDYWNLVKLQRIIILKKNLRQKMIMLLFASSNTTQKPLFAKNSLIIIKLMKMPSDFYQNLRRRGYQYLNILRNEKIIPLEFICQETLGKFFCQYCLTIMKKGNSQIAYSNQESLIIEDQS